MREPNINERMVAHMERLLVTQGYSPQTRDTYIRWTQRFTKFMGYPHPRQIGTREIAAFLDHLANDRRLAAATRNQAAAAIKFLMREVLASDAADSIKNSKGPKYVPTVLSHAEASMILREMSGRKRLACRLQYGTGMRIGETVNLRIKDIDFELARIDIQEGKGGKGRVLMLPNALRSDLRKLIDIVTRQHKTDMERETGWVSLPDALHIKKPRAGYELGWQFLFNSRTLTRDPATERRGRFHLSRSALQKAFHIAVKRSGSPKPATCHTLRHSFATEILRAGYDLPTLKELLGHNDIRTTMIYTHVVDQVGMGVRSPLDRDDRADP